MQEPAHTVQEDFEIAPRPAKKPIKQTQSAVAQLN